MHRRSCKRGQESSGGRPSLFAPLNIARPQPLRASSMRGVSPALVGAPLGLAHNGCRSKALRMKINREIKASTSASVATAPGDRTHQARANRTQGDRRKTWRPGRNPGKCHVFSKSEPGAPVFGRNSVRPPASLGQPCAPPVLWCFVHHSRPVLACANLARPPILRRMTKARVGDENRSCRHAVTRWSSLFLLGLVGPKVARCAPFASAQNKNTGIMPEAGLVLAKLGHFVGRIWPNPGQIWLTFGNM